VVEEANDEAPIQSWLEANPGALLAFLQGQTNAWVFGRPRLGAEYIPDFMICEQDSRGYQWHLVELESPRFPVLTGSGMQSAKLTQAKK